MKLSQSATLRTKAVITPPDVVHGFVVDTADLHRRFVVTLLTNGVPFAAVLANQFDPLLAADGIGDGHYGFVALLPAAAAIDLTSVRVAIANSGDLLPAPVIEPDAASSHLPHGVVDMPRHLRITGWIASGQTAAPVVIASHAGIGIAAVRADRWRHVAVDEGHGVAARGFQLDLPAAFADGQVRFIDVKDDGGRTLIGSPVPVLGYGPSLRHWLAAYTRFGDHQSISEIYDERFPASIPMTRYAGWRDGLPRPVAAFDRASTGLIVVGVPPAECAPAIFDGMVRVDLTRLAAACPFSFDPGELDHSLNGRLAGCTTILFVRHGTSFCEGSIGRLVNGLAAHPDAIGAYGDLEIAGPDGELSLVSWPAYDAERMSELGYAAEAFALRRSALPQNSQSLFDLVLAAGKEAGNKTSPFVHVPGPIARRNDVLPCLANDTLADAVRRNTADEATPPVIESRRDPIYASVVLRRPSHVPSVTIIREQHPAESRSVAVPEVMGSAADHDRLEIISITDGQIVEARSGRILTSFPHYTPRAQRFNLAVTFAKNQTVVFSTHHNHIVDWPSICVLSTQLAAPDVHAVGPLLVYGSGLIGCAGYAVGGPNVLEPLCNDRYRPGIESLGLLGTARRVSALPLEGLAVRLDAFQAIGGFDVVNFPAVLLAEDFCLTLQARGGKVTWTPDAHLTLVSHWDNRNVHPTRQRSERAFRCRWADVMQDDPSSSPLYAKDAPLVALAASNGRLAPRMRQPPHRRPIPRLY